MIKLFHTYISPQAKNYVNQVMDSGYLNQGKFVEQFESELKDRFDIHNLLTVNSCTSALHMALEHVGVRGREVILPAQTFIATGLAVIMAGGVPVFTDIDDNGNLDPEAVFSNITSKTACIIAVHWGGLPARVLDLPTSIPVIEDAAHALGATLNGIPVGNISEYTCFSFQAIKFLTTSDGGAIAYNNPLIGDDLRRMRWFGIDKATMQRTLQGDRDVSVEQVGFKYHMNDFCASMGLGNLCGIDLRLARRRNIANFYLSELFSVEKIRLPTLYHKVEPSWWLFTVRVEDRDSFITHMAQHDIECSVVDRRIDRNPVFGGLRDLPRQELFDQHQVSIPCHEGLNDDDVSRIVQAIKRF